MSVVGTTSTSSDLGPFLQRRGGDICESLTLLRRFFGPPNRNAGFHSAVSPISNRQGLSIERRFRTNSGPAAWKPCATWFRAADTAPYRWDDVEIRGSRPYHSVQATLGLRGFGAGCIAFRCSH
jgi:hypothetical protein